MPSNTIWNRIAHILRRATARPEKMGKGNWGPNGSHTYKWIKHSHNMYYTAYTYDNKRPPLRPYDIVLDGTPLNVLGMIARSNTETASRAQLHRNIWYNYSILAEHVVAFSFLGNYQGVFHFTWNGETNACPSTSSGNLRGWDRGHVYFLYGYICYPYHLSSFYYE